MSQQDRGLGLVHLKFVSKRPWWVLSDLCLQAPRPDGSGLFLRFCKIFCFFQSAIRNLQWEGVVTMKVVKIRGKNRIDVKKKVLDYYFCNRDQLGESLKEFFKRCIIDPNGKTVIIRGQWWTHPTQVTNGRRKGMEEKLYPLSSFLALKPCQANTNTLQPSARSGHQSFIIWNLPSALCPLPSAFSIDNPAILC
jgi:hypothetical protein